jgi:hypothetical protein
MNRRGNHIRRAAAIVMIAWLPLTFAPEGVARGVYQPPEEFVREVFAGHPPAAPQLLWPNFAAAFYEMRAACEGCHRSNARAYIELPIPKHAGSPVLGMD